MHTAPFVTFIWGDNVLSFFTLYHSRITIKSILSRGLCNWRLKIWTLILNRGGPINQNCVRRSCFSTADHFVRLLAERCQNLPLETTAGWFTRSLYASSFQFCTFSSPWPQGKTWLLFNSTVLFQLCVHKPGQNEIGSTRMEASNCSTPEWARTDKNHRTGQRTVASHQDKDSEVMSCQNVYYLYSSWSIQCLCHSPLSWEPLTPLLFNIVA